MTKIFYVEDEAFLAKIVKESLERLQYEVLHLTDGINIPKRYKEFQPDICILDIMLPHKNGYEIAQEIRGIDQTVPIIFLTAKSQTQDLVAGFQSGGNDYIKKPFSMEELNIRIQNLLSITQDQKKKNNTIEQFQLGENYIFHPKKQILSYGASTRNLSHKEAQILKLLAINKNATCERKEILLKIWGDDSYFNSRNLDVYIRKLRRYLEDDKKIKIITLKGVGYHFLVD